jgi:hypothetical protein
MHINLIRSFVQGADLKGVREQLPSFFFFTNIFIVMNIFLEKLRKKNLINFF